jgi:hypothetical protein
VFKSLGRTIYLFTNFVQLDPHGADGNGTHCRSIIKEDIPENFERKSYRRPRFLICVWSTGTNSRMDGKPISSHNVPTKFQRKIICTGMFCAEFRLRQRVLLPGVQARTECGHPLSAHLRCHGLPVEHAWKLRRRVQRVSCR